MSEHGAAYPTAGHDFRWEQINGFFLRFDSFIQWADVDGDRVGPALMGAFGIVNAELPNPDVAPAQRLITLPIHHKSDYKSVFRAQLDGGVRDGTNELVLLYEHRRGLFGGKRASLHIAAFPAGTWRKFFDAVSRYESKRFHWPSALFVFQPSKTQVFSSANIIPT